MTPAEAGRIAYVAHGACGQRRADGKTPYIRHPERVVDLTQRFSESLELPASGAMLEDRLVAAWLHDVLEDTRLRRADLIHLGVEPNQLRIVELLTEPSDESSMRSYFTNIGKNDDALVVKCADRCSNLEDALTALVAPDPLSPKRWERYHEKTVRDLLPLYDELPGLRAELTSRLDRIAKALPGALARRTSSTKRKRVAAGLHDDD